MNQSWDKKNRICECCGKTLATPQKVCQHYSSTKNQCSLPSENNNNQRRVNTPKVTRPIRPKSPRPRLPSPVPAPVVHTKGKDRRKEKITPTPVLEPELEKELPKTKTVITSSKPGEVERQDAHDRNARKSGKHLRTWGARLRRRWIKVTGEECDLPKTLKECQRLHHDLLQADDEARENDQEDPEAGPGPSAQTHDLAPPAREGLAPIPQDEVQDIHFEECPVGRDLERPHQNRSLMSKWVGKVPQPEGNPAYAFNQPIDKPEEYKNMSYMPQLMGLIRPKITEVLQTELRRKDQIKSAIVALCLYSITKRNPDGTTVKSYIEYYHKGGMRAILSEGDIDEHITKSAGKIDNHIEKTLKKGSGYVLEQNLEISIEAYTLRRGTGGSFIPTPKKLANTKSTINPDNKGSA
ncbi:hypothetical protein GLOIN_2v1480811 [Rhizophagus clarus]|uniref:Uncharacterized protein n=1 Tax=Rhizophagus clarus TaxID=94130 RepID=A0A8H3M105_9GLOM|nr:hypothetical protein GLOIN_2v1480811 [Rhizophagus clarus]